MTLNIERRIKASQAKEGMWIIHNNPRFNERIVSVSKTRDGQVKIHSDYGNGGEPATLFFEKDDPIVVL
jgi:hypothetical protein